MSLFFEFVVAILAVIVIVLIPIDLMFYILLVTAICTLPLAAYRYLIKQQAVASIRAGLAAFLNAVICAALLIVTGMAPLIKTVEIILISLVWCFINFRILTHGEVRTVKCSECGERLPARKRDTATCPMCGDVYHLNCGDRHRKKCNRMAE